jgi:hypothetical protein
MKAITTFAFLQWQDWNQGAFLLDDTQSLPRWRSVLWDADQAFAGLRDKGIPSNRAAWKNFRDAHGMRASVFKGIWDTSPRFRKEMLWHLTWNINHRLTPDWIKDRILHYAWLEKEAGLECFDEDLALSYLLKRREELLDETVRELNVPNTVRCRVKSPDPLVIDGETWTNAYEGIYFAGQNISIEAPSRRSFSHWEVDGRKVLEPRLELDLHSDTDIRAVFSPD